MTVSDERSDRQGDASHSRLAVRHELYDRFGPAQVGVSADGRTAVLTAPVDSGLQVGGFAVLEGEPGDGWSSLVVQIRSMSLVEREGPQLDVDATFSDVDEGLSITGATVRPVLRALTGSGTVLGVVDGEQLDRIDSVEPFGERAVRPARPDEVAIVVDGLAADVGSIEVGTQRQAADVAAHLVSKGFARHTFMCGQSGSGKTYTTGVLFERLLTETSLPIVILDPNSDHIHLGQTRDPDDHSPETERFRAAASSVRVARVRGLDATHVLCIDFSDLGIDWQALLLRLHPIDDADEFGALRRLTAPLAEPYGVDDVIEAAEQLGSDDPLVSRLVRRITNLGIADWDIWRREGETSLARLGLRDERCVVIDLGSLTRPDERTTVALAVLVNRWRHRRERNPALIAIDEAHNVLPAVTRDPLLVAATEIGIQIAGEGRKFGLHLFVATQRPSKVHPNVVSQCDNLVLMRMNGTGDVDDLTTLFSHVPESMIRASTAFGLGQALFAGPISPVPTMAQVGLRRSPEGGGDVPTTWAASPTPSAQGAS